MLPSIELLAGSLQVLFYMLKLKGQTTIWSLRAKFWLLPISLIKSKRRILSWVYSKMFSHTTRLRNLYFSYGVFSFDFFFAPLETSQLGPEAGYISLMLLDLCLKNVACCSAQALLEYQMFSWSRPISKRYIDHNPEFHIRSFSPPVNTRQVTFA